MGHDWLQQYLEEAVRARLCVSFHCTTCGALPFRQGVLEALANETGQTRGDYRDRSTVQALAGALAALPRDPRTTHGIARILSDLWSGIPGLDAELRTMLDGSPAVALLRSMEAHYADLQARHAAQAAYDAPEAVAQRRAERQAERVRLTQPVLDARAARKAERDRLWRSRQAAER